jgi:hypothetical protein
MSFGRFGLVLGIAGALAAGCVVETEATPPPGLPYPDITSFCSAAANAVCNATVVRACYGSDDASLPADTQQCVAAYSQLAACNPAGLPYHALKAEACLAQIQAMYADGVVSASELEKVDEACVLVFNKGGGAGSSCTVDSDCDSNTELGCVIKAGNATGTCQVPEPANGGQSCSAPNAECIEGNYCDPSSTRCFEMPAQGEACSDIIPCPDNCLCSAPTGGICNLKTANGQTCTENSACQSGFCTKPINGTDGVCTQTSALAVTSANCQPFLP